MNKRHFLILGGVLGGITSFFILSASLDIWSGAFISIAVVAVVLIFIKKGDNRIQDKRGPAPSDGSKNRTHTSP
jgi:hypothetical protein